MSNANLAICSLCKESAFGFWATNPATLGQVFCPACFGRKQCGSALIFPYALYFGVPTIDSGVWHQSNLVGFGEVVAWVEGELKIPRQTSLRVLMEISFQEATRKLHDLTHDPSAIPHWKNQVEYNEGEIARQGKRQYERAELRARNIFLLRRIDDCLKLVPKDLLVLQLWKIERLRLLIKAWRDELPFLEPAAPLLEINWEMLEPSGDGWREILGHMEILANALNKKIDKSRLQILNDLKPDLRFIGRSGFQGYVAFIFEKGKTAVLESPFVGDALYLMDSSNWREFSKLSKTELLTRHQADVSRVIHYDSGWSGKLKRKLRARGVI